MDGKFLNTMIAGHNKVNAVIKDLETLAYGFSLTGNTTVMNKLNTQIDLLQESVLETQVDYARAQREYIRKIDEDNTHIVGAMLQAATQVRT